MILVTGATGQLGSSVVAQLKKILNPEQFVVSSSNKEGIAKLESQGLKARLANFGDSSTLNEALKGISKVLIISTMEQNRAQQHKNVIDAAKAQGVKHVFYTSLAIKDIQTSAVKDLMISHFETEEYLKESGLAYTVLRNTMYADALTQILGQNALNQDIFLPGGKGLVPYALRREMGEATANALTQEGHENKIYNITGSKSYSYTDVAEALSDLTGKKIAYNDIPEGDFVATLQKIGFPEFLVYLHAGTIKDIKETQYEIEDITLEKLLGRPTAELKSFLKELFEIK